MLNYKMIKKVKEIRQKMLKINVNKLMRRQITVIKIKKAGTVQSLHNTPYYNTDLDILWSYWGSQ